MPLSPKELQHIAARTLAHYEQHARSYWAGTRDHDVSQNIAALLKHIPGPAPFDLRRHVYFGASRLCLGGGQRVRFAEGRSAGKGSKARARAYRSTAEAKRR
jgi:hypothetical protein